jgi:DNA polymerase I-like protein with 3'-5' exonuclease and polymerase domains
MPTKLKLRSFVKAPPGKLLISCDLSQAETWVVAFLANDPNMKHSLTYSDIHRDTGVAIFKKPATEITSQERYTAKRVNHASSYRMNKYRLTEVYNKDAIDNNVPPITISQSGYFQEVWHTLYINIKSWWSNIEVQLGTNMTLVTPYGRRRQFFEFWGDELFKEATAYVPQATVADHFNGFVQPELGIEGGLKGFWKVHKDNREIKIIQQGHDSGVLEVPKEHASDICKEFMTILHRPLMINGETFTIPVDGEIGEDWGHMERMK